ncbi:putative GTP pyrophosphokinase [Paenibacillus cellulosilyticus]|uniref:Putative GTP pyrophosphokinase n=1 Tax=Paenibacillus cellulosilyticus TaxID=375489 RepID=A0A2V2Z0L0_9BACL|nr:GTP pyrophosphokinase family protein [Paenibacillus cellulosilyticus]PWW06109.1 putative GTP pyrophosphokinase [Paenibacillus cellulosilyticus]QKS43116.1 GTP pyrophosphokinase family protein [Paenibacillus cellulosilyticus]
MNSQNQIDQLEQLKHFKNKITRFLMVYKFALDEMETKIEILKEEFHLLHDYNPIEHTKSRLKSPESMMNKLFRKGCELSLDSMKRNIKDIAGIRITCSFISDIYRISDMLRRQHDLRIIETKDYIKHPKPNGYQSLHMLVEVPVYMSDGMEHVCVEIQIRTIAMDFWASLEHKIFYKYNAAVPQHLLEELKSAADSANALDKQMEQLHREISEIKEANAASESEMIKRITISNQQFSLPSSLLDLIVEETKE